MFDLFDVCSNHAPLNYMGQNSKNNLQSIILTYLWPWNKVELVKISMICYTSSKVIIMQSLKDIPYTVSTKMPTLKFLSNKKKKPLYLPWTCANMKNSGIFIIYLIYLAVLKSFNFIGQEHKIFSYNCLTLLWPWNMVNVTESGTNR